MSAKPYRQRRSAHTPAAQGSKWIAPSTRWAIYHRDDFACVYCGHVGGLSLDHLHSVEARGRDNSACNLVTCCVRCNSSKKALTQRQWFAKLRARGIDTTAVRRRISRQTLTPIDRARGRYLAGEHDARSAEAIETSMPPDALDRLLDSVLGPPRERETRAVQAVGSLHVRPLGAPLPKGHVEP